jgi:hypothetical protein
MHLSCVYLTPYLFWKIFQSIHFAVEASNQGEVNFEMTCAIPGVGIDDTHKAIAHRTIKGARSDSAKQREAREVKTEGFDNLTLPPHLTVAETGCENL